jgi:hypothetical protein
MKEVLIDIDNFRKGYYALDDTTKAPIGSARIMENTQITDRGGIAPRLGSEILGTINNASFGVKGLYNYKRSFGQDEILIKNYGTYMQGLSKNNQSAGWFTIKSDFASDKEYGYISSLVNTSNQDYLVGCNRYDPYFSWTGTITTLSSNVSNGATTIPVTSVLTNEIFESKTASANSATTLDISSAVWGTSMWVNMYVYITSGASTGKIRKITANTTTQITFDTLGGAPGNCTFEIRQLAFPTSGSVIYGGNTVTYTSIDVYNALITTSASAGTSGDIVSTVITSYPEAPRGNRIANYLARSTVGNVRSAMARDAGGALQGYSQGGSVFVSKIQNPFDFSYAASRIAGEGDIIGMPYGGGEITDMKEFEDTVYAFKKKYIEAIQYTQDVNDLPQRTPLKSGIGSIGKVIKGSDDIYFITDDKQFTSIGRVKTKDIKPQTLNMGYSIKRFLDDCDFGEIGKGIEYRDKIYIPCKTNNTKTINDIVLVYNKNFSAFEGIYNLSASFFDEWNDKLVFSEAGGANIWQLLTGHSDVNGSARYPIVSQYATHYMNLTPRKSSLQAMHSLYVEGYIGGGTQVTFNLWKDFEMAPFFTFNFASTETGLLDGSVTGAFLGGAPLGIGPLGSIAFISDTDVDQDGRRHFHFRIYFPFQYGNFFSVGHNSDGVDYDYEVSRYGLGIAEEPAVDIGHIK